jgi:hypothetical protein
VGAQSPIKNPTNTTQPATERVSAGAPSLGDISPTSAEKNSSPSAGRYALILVVTLAMLAALLTTSVPFFGDVRHEWERERHNSN